MQHFLYMLRRDKKGMILLMVFNGEKISKTVIHDFKILGFDKEKTKTLEDFYIPHKMNYEVILESSDDFNSLKKRLLERGYRNLPVSNQPQFSNWKRENPINFLKTQKIMLQKRNPFVKK